MNVKICGITNLADARLAVELGAGLLGFNFYPKSPRCLPPEECQRICVELERLAPQVIRVGVFVNHPAGEILDLLKSCGLHLAQLSGDEASSELAALGGLAYKGLRGSSLSGGLDEYLRADAPRLLLDASVPGQYGGTGQTADWPAAAQLASRYELLLAGGLTVGNVAAAVRQVRPWGVDVASGVESQPGRKDPVKLAAFIENARHAERTLA